MPNNLNEQIIAFLRQDELNYPEAASKFGAEAIPFLNELVKSDDENLASKAAYLASYIGNEGSADVMAVAAASRHAPVRVAAAYGAQMLKPALAEKVLKSSIADADPGVLKVAMRSVQKKKLSASFSKEIAKMAKSHPIEAIKLQAQKIALK